MSDAAVGLVGVVIGGLLSAGTSYLTGVRAERRRQRGEERTIARLIEVELGRTATTIGLLKVDVEEKLRREHDAKDVDEMLMAAQERGEAGRMLAWALGSGRLRKLETTVWQTQTERLAASLDKDLWVTVQAAYESIERLTQIDEVLHEQGRMPDQMPGFAFADLESADSAVLKARAALIPLARG